MNILDAAVYCGTYHKYNCGSIDGAWLRLADYPTKTDFMTACRKVHKDELDPEFMFQDRENIPSSLISESYIDDSIWSVLAICKTFPKDTMNEFIEWCEDNGAEQDFDAVNEFWQKRIAEPIAKAMHKANDWKECVRAEYEKMYPNDHKHVEWRISQCSTALRFSDGLIMEFGKPKIETEFCFGYSDFGQGPTREEAYAQRNNFGESQFLRENLREFDKDIKQLEELSDNENVYLSKATCIESLFCYYFIATDWDIQAYPSRYSGIIRVATKDEVKQILESKRSERAKFEKRLKSYLKRYGTSKLRLWTYWMDE